MLTTEPGPDMAPYHNRQIARAPGRSLEAWLDARGAGARPAEAPARRITGGPAFAQMMNRLRGGAAGPAASYQAAG